MRLSNKLVGQWYVKERLKSSLRKLFGRYGDHFKLYEVHRAGMLLDMIIYSNTVHRSDITQIIDPVTALDLIIEFDFIPNCAKFL